MTAADFGALLPLLIVGYGAVALMTVVALRRGHDLAFGLTLGILAAALLSVPAALAYTPRAVTSLLQIDAFSLYFTGLVVAVGILVTLFCRDYLEARERESEGFYVLLLLAVDGMATMASSAHFASFVLALETLSVALYGLIGYTRAHRPSVEGAVKYLILAATSSAFLLLGIALVYSDYGTMDFRGLAPLLAAGGIPTVAFLGLGLILVGFGFKLAVVPFHMWSPDVYQGAPAPVTALIASGSKGATLALLLRLVTLAALPDNRSLFIALFVLAVVTMTVGNLLALLQTNLKRLLAYSSIAHIGYLLIPLLAGGPNGPSSVAFYLAAYSFSVIAAFGVIAVLSSSQPGNDLERLEDYRGLGLRRRGLAAVLALAMLSLTGIPLTAGFFGKWFIFTAAAGASLWGLLIVAVVNSGVAAFYYLRVLFALYAPPEGEPQLLPTTRPAGVVALAVSTAAVVIFGVYPMPLIRMAEAAALHIGF